MDTKPTNPKDAVGIRKAPMSCVPSGVMMELAVAMMEGARKYGRHNYRVAGIRYSVYYDALMRHMMAWWEGEDFDADSGVNHVTKAIATLVVLRDAMMNEKYTDDRPPKMPFAWMEGMNMDASALIDNYPQPIDAHVQTDYNDKPGPGEIEIITEDQAKRRAERVGPPRKVSDDYVPDTHIKGLFDHETH